MLIAIRHDADDFTKDPTRDDLRVMTGTDLADIMTGDEDNDMIEGEAGNDIIDGGGGQDDLYGGAGDDLFVYKSGYGITVIKDFRDVGDEDKIDLRDFDFGRDDWETLRKIIDSTDSGIVIKLSEAEAGTEGDILYVQSSTISQEVVEGNMDDFFLV